MELATARILVAEAIGTFALVFAGAGAVMVEREDGGAWSHRRRNHIRTRDHGDDLCRRAHLRRAFQRGRHIRIRPHSPFPLVARRGLLVRSAGGRRRRRAPPAGLTRRRRRRGRDASRRLASAIVLLRAGDDRVPDVRDPGRGDRHESGGRGGRDRDRRDDCPRRHVRGTDLGSFHESDALDRPRHRLRNFHALWLYIVAPLLGAALGGLAYQFVRGESTPR